MKFNENKITIVTRDINGKRSIVEFDNESAVLRWLNAGSLDEEDEVLIVAQGGICLYSALSAQYPLTEDDLAGFFA
jgi:hypothetical protein